MNFPPKAARFTAEGGTKRPQFELAITRCFEVEIGQPGGRWKAESQGFPTQTIRASEDLAISSYGRFEIVPPPADFFKKSCPQGSNGRRWTTLTLSFPEVTEFLQIDLKTTSCGEFELGSRIMASSKRTVSYG